MACPLDRVDRQFKAPRPNALWISDFTYVATSALRAAKALGSGFVHVAFAVEPKGSLDIDAYARRIVGWRVSRTAHASFVLNALEQASHERRPAQVGGPVHHPDRGSHHLALCCTERLAEAGVAPSVGSVGNSCDNALAETINGLFKSEVTYRRGPWRSFEAVAFATLEKVDWFNTRRLLEPIGNILPAEAKARSTAMAKVEVLAACLKPNSLRETRGGSNCDWQNELPGTFDTGRVRHQWLAGVGASRSTCDSKASNAALPPLTLLNPVYGVTPGRFTPNSIPSAKSVACSIVTIDDTMEQLPCS